MEKYNKNNLHLAKNDLDQNKNDLDQNKNNLNLTNDLNNDLNKAAENSDNSRLGEDILWDILKTEIVVEDSKARVIIRNNDFKDDVRTVTELIIKMSRFFLEITSSFNTKGYINNTDIEVRGLRDFIVKVYKLQEKKIPPKYCPSLLTNVLYFNMVMLVLYITITRIEKSKVFELLEEDLLVDFKVLKSKVLTMIEPVIKDRLRNKSIIVSINGFVGFDTEYELESSKLLKNKLLSIQLASTTNLTILVPKTSVNKLGKHELKNYNSSSGYGDDHCIKIITAGIDTLISIYRDEFMNNSLKALDLIHDSFKDCLKYENDSYSLYSTNKTDFETKIKHFNVGDNDNNTGYSTSDLLWDCESMVDGYHYKNVDNFVKTIDELLNKNRHSLTIPSESKELVNKDIDDPRVVKAVKSPYSRISYGLGHEKLSISLWKNLYVIMHESSADLSMLNDFSRYKDCFNVVGRSFVTMGKPFELKNHIDDLEQSPEWIFRNNESLVGSRVFFRDTALIAPAGAKSLSEIGKIYGDEFRKIDIGNYRAGNMSNLRTTDPELFNKYAIQDAIIALKHGISMEEFYLTLGKTGVPLTNSGIGKSYVENEWLKSRYPGYQLDSDILIGDLGISLTPKKSRDIDFSKYIVLFMASYRGGRNESFMYGFDSKNKWFDYDLTSCYSTVMSLLGTPDYEYVRVLNGKELNAMKDFEFLFGYYCIEVNFAFPSNIKYPCIPTRVDDDVDIYPLKGSSIITGLEYIIAKSMGCKITVKNCVYVPFKSTRDKDKDDKPNPKRYSESMLTKYTTPFRNIVKELQSLRRKYPKKSFYNLLYKEIANSIYGLIAMGLSGKNKFDTTSKSYKKIQGNFLTNPLLASYITGFVRALIAECLHNVNILGGKVVSVTTDGFICNIEDLESKILASDKTSTTLLKVYRDLRKMLTIEYDEKGVVTNPGDPSALEVKNVEENGLLSWKTRGQMGSSGSIIAATGYQHKGADREQLFNNFRDIITNDQESKVFNYVSQRLIGAVDVYRKDCNVMVVYSDRRYELSYDDKRSIIENNVENQFLDSKPWPTVEEYRYIRCMKNLVSKPVFHKNYICKSINSYTEHLETSVRGFISASVSDVRRFGVPVDQFKSYKEIIEFVYGYEPARSINITPSMISHLKHRKTIPRSVPRTRENELFIEYVSNRIPTFEIENFFREMSSESIRLLKKSKKSS